MATSTSTAAPVSSIHLAESFTHRASELTPRVVHPAHALPVAHVPVAHVPVAHVPTTAQSLQPKQPVAAPLPATALALRRQRFYPAQWQRLVTPKIKALADSRQQRVDWIGWDRSLPRMYLSIDALSKLVIEGIDLVTSQLPNIPSASAKPSPMPRPGVLSLRVAWQLSLQQSLVLVLEHPHWQCDAHTMGAINAQVTPSASQFHGDIAAASRLLRCAKSLGAYLGIAPVLGGGSLLRISLPVDQPLPLVRTWIESLQREGMERSSFRLHIIGRTGSENVSQLAAADARLQSLARAGDMVYRVGYGRWLWLTVHDSLPGFVQTSAWQSQAMQSWPVPIGMASHSVAIQEGLVKSIADTMSSLMQRHLPPLDSLNRSQTAIQPSAAAARRTSNRTTNRVLHATNTRNRPSPYEAPSRLDPHSPLPAPAHLTTANRQPRRWRYPI